MRYMLIQPSGLVTVDNTDEWGLGFIQKAVGGYIEAVTAPLDHSGYANEEAKLVGLEANFYATLVCYTAGLRDIIAGPMVVVGPVDAKGNDTSLTVEFLELMLPMLSDIGAVVGAMLDGSDPELAEMMVDMAGGE